MTDRGWRSSRWPARTPWVARWSAFKLPDHCRNPDLVELEQMILAEARCSELLGERIG